MSDLIQTTNLSLSSDCPKVTAKPVYQKLPTRIAQIGEDLTIRRALPHRDRRMVGAWCFLDHFGPLDLKHSKGLDIAPHPHIGLQTFTWTVAGEIVHKDSLGSLQVIKPGQVNLMIAGKGIAHSEESLPGNVLHGVQLWIALPDPVRHCEPEFKHYPEIPSFIRDGMQIHVLVGEYASLVSPVQVHTPLLGLELFAIEDSVSVLSLNPKFEYGILPLVGHVCLEEEDLSIESFLYLGCGRSELTVRIKKGARALLIGGEPFKEEIIMWWNFVARTRDELEHAALAWRDHTDFGEVLAYVGGDSIAPKF